MANKRATRVVLRDSQITSYASTGILSLSILSNTLTNYFDNFESIGNIYLNLNLESVTSRFNIYEYTSNIIFNILSDSYTGIGDYESIGNIYLNMAVDTDTIISRTAGKSLTSIYATSMFYT